MTQRGEPFACRRVPNPHTRCIARSHDLCPVAVPLERTSLTHETDSADVVAAERQLLRAGLRVEDVDESVMRHIREAIIIGTP